MFMWFSCLSCVDHAVSPIEKTKLLRSIDEIKRPFASKESSDDGELVSDVLSACKDKRLISILQGNTWVFLFFYLKKQLICFFLRTFVPASARCGSDVIWEWRSRWVEHYILEGVTDALFLVESKLPQSNWGQEHWRGNSTECSIYSP